MVCVSQFCLIRYQSFYQTPYGKTNIYSQYNIPYLIYVIYNSRHDKKNRHRIYYKPNDSPEKHPYQYRNFNTCMGKLKMKHLPHDGRHTFASLMDSAGANDVCIKLIMGHSMKNDTTKGTYTHKTLGELLAEVNKI